MIKYLKDIKLILDYMNQEWPPPAKGIPSQKYVDGKLTKFFAKVDPYFTAYCTDENWWICVSDYWVWKESYSTIIELVGVLKTKCKIIPCHIHPVQVKQYKDSAKIRKHIKLFVGQISWA